jgi:hypothetical protein
VNRPPVHDAVQHQACELPLEIGLHRRSSPRSIFTLNRRRRRPDSPDRNGGRSSSR